MRTRRLLKWFFSVTTVLALLVLLVPWKPFVEKKLVSMLAEKGIAPAQVSIDHIGWRGLVLKDVTLGEPPLKLATLTLAYQPRALLDGRIEDVVLTGLTIRAGQGDNGWNVEGLQNFLRSKTSNKPAAIPVTKAALAALPLSSIAANDSHVSVAGKAIQAEFPLRILLQQKDVALLELESISPTIQFGENKVAIGRIKIDLVMDKTKPQWNGIWAMDDIALTSDALVVPPLNANGTATIFADKMELKGTATSKDASHKADFLLSYSLAKPASSFVLLKQLRMPFNGGKLATRDVKFLLDGKKHPLKFTLALSAIDVNALMQTLTSNRATGTGVVSGTVPVTITADGKIRVGKGSLKAQAPGQITLSPEVIPGDNAQVTLVREVMKNLQYNVLALEFGMADDNTLSAKLAVEGANPDVEGGRPIKLTINLSGDLLDLILQNVMLMTDPKSFIEQKNHEKNN
jgi:Dicarboxylate transport